MAGTWRVEPGDLLEPGVELRPHVFGTVLLVLDDTSSRTVRTDADLNSHARFVFADGDISWGRPSSSSSESTFTGLVKSLVMFITIVYHLLVTSELCITSPLQGYGSCLLVSLKYVAFWFTHESNLGQLVCQVGLVSEKR